MVAAALKKSFYNSRILWMMKQHLMIIGQDHLLKLINYHNWKSLQSFNSNYDGHFLPKWLAFREGRRLLLQLSSQIRKSKVEYNLNFFMPIINYVPKIRGYSCLFTKKALGQTEFLSSEALSLQRRVSLENSNQQLIWAKSGPWWSHLTLYCCC